MLLLAIDTSTTAITVALHDGHRVLAEATTLDARAHAEHVAPSIVAVLAEVGAAPADVTAVVAGTGPGPFTGLRVGLVTARTFAYARGIPVYGVCSLDALAHQAWCESRPREPTGSQPGAREWIGVQPGAREWIGVRLGAAFVVATDARRKEVYWARYTVTDGGALRVGEPAVAKAAAIAAQAEGLAVVGRGALLYPDSFGPRVGPLDVSAAYLGDVAARSLAAGDALAGPDPLYLRRPDAAVPAARKPVLS